MTRSKSRRALTRDEYKAAALICARNAEELLADAWLLFSHKRYARCMFLSCIGNEELGKAAVALEIYVTGRLPESVSEVADFWEFWRHHFSKAVRGAGYVQWNTDLLQEKCPELVPLGHANWHRHEDQKRRIYSKMAEAETKMKEASLYADFVDRSSQGRASGFSLPTAWVTEERARRILSSLQERVEKLRPEINTLGLLSIPPYPPDEYEEYLASQIDAE